MNASKDLLITQIRILGGFVRALRALESKEPTPAILRRISTLNNASRQAGLDLGNLTQTVSIIIEGKRAGGLSPKEIKRVDDLIEKVKTEARQLNLKRVRILGAKRAVIAKRVQGNKTGSGPTGRNDPKRRL